MSISIKIKDSSIILAQSIENESKNLSGLQNPTGLKHEIAKIMGETK